jgi:hypothetical protein
MQPKGLADKLYWRQHRALWHCFEKAKLGVYESLCGAHTLPRSYGQAIDRPEAVLRCARCDSEEMKLRGWSESGPATKEQR